MEEYLPITRSARINRNGELHSETEFIWMVLHGQLSPFFIRKFNALDPNVHHVITPEGPHRYYLSGNHGRVGAGWMTKEKREVDIADNTDTLIGCITNTFHPTLKEK